MKPLRRSVLKTLGMGAIAPLLQPMVRGMLPEAFGPTNTRKRILFYVDPLGVDHGKSIYRPLDAGGGAINVNGFTALEPYKSKMTVIDGLYNPFNLHLHGNQWAFTMMPGIGVEETMQPGGGSIDRVLAQSLGLGDPFSSLSFFAWPASRERPGFSADGASKPYPAMSDLVAAYASIFGKLATPTMGGGDAATGRGGAPQGGPDRPRRRPRRRRPAEHAAGGGREDEDGSVSHVDPRPREQAEATLHRGRRLRQACSAGPGGQPGCRQG
jgi:hypothetical protein